MAQFKDTLRYNRARLTDRQIDKLIGLAKGITADHVVNEEEAKFLRKWLIANKSIKNDSLLDSLFLRVEEMLSDDTLNKQESKELLEILKNFTGGHFEMGEVAKSSTLPLDTPQPKIFFPKKRFCFTGTFQFGNRKACELVVNELGGVTGSLTTETDYLVVGTYATDDWIHSIYGRKIEKALAMKKQKSSIAIISEKHWSSYLKKA